MGKPPSLEISKVSQCPALAGASHIDLATITESNADHMHQTEVKAWSKYSAAANAVTEAVNAGTSISLLWVITKHGTDAVSR